MKTEYVQAFMRAITQGTSVDAALIGLKRTLQRKQHMKLYASVLREVVRTLESDKGGTKAVVTVANAADIAALKEQISAALQTLGTTDSTPITEVIDKSLIGGFVATYDYKERDQSYKTALKSLYESIVK